MGDRTSRRAPSPRFPPFSCSSTPRPPLPLRVSRPLPLLRLHCSHDPQVFIRLVPQPLVLGWFSFPNTARSWHWHSSSSRSVFAVRHGFLHSPNSNDQISSCVNIGDWHRPRHGHGRQRAEPEYLLHAGYSMILLGR